MRLFLTLIILALLPMFTSCNFIKEKGWFGAGKKEAAAALQAKQDSIRIADSIMAVQEELFRIEKAKADAIAAEEARIAREASMKYQMVIGSFYTPDFATRMSAKYSQMGYSTRIIDMKGSNFKLVSVEAFDDFKTAVGKLEKYRAELEPEAWIYVMR